MENKYFTGKGDSGFSSTINYKLFKKDDIIFHALGDLDELNSYLGTVKSSISKTNPIFCLISSIQQSLFSIQAQIAGATNVEFDEDKVKFLEEKINNFSSVLSSQDKFILSGEGTQLGAALDYARTIARRAERSLVHSKISFSPNTSEFLIPYLNRLSSLLYVLARYENRYCSESNPEYK